MSTGAATPAGELSASPSSGMSSTSPSARATSSAAGTRASTFISATWQSPSLPAALAARYVRRLRHQRFAPFAIWVWASSWRSWSLSSSCTAISNISICGVRAGVRQELIVRACCGWGCTGSVPDPGRTGSGHERSPLRCFCSIQKMTLLSPLRAGFFSPIHRFTASTSNSGYGVRLLGCGLRLSL